jgi:hypothetical protein
MTCLPQTSASVLTHLAFIRTHWGETHVSGVGYQSLQVTGKRGHMGRAGPARGPVNLRVIRRERGAVDI